MTILRKSSSKISFSTALREVTGLNNKYIVYNLVARNLKIRYRKSILGIFWTMLIPAFTAIVYYFVFQYVMKFSLPNYLFFLLVGLIPWTFMNTSMTLGLESIVVNHSILNKVPMPLFVFPLSENITSFINLIFSIPVLVFVGFLMKVDFYWTWLLVPIYIFVLFLTTYLMTIISSILYVYFRDLRHVLTVVLQAWFYVTPVIYEASMIPERFKFLLYLNPVGLIFHGLHQSLSAGKLISLEEVLIMGAWVFVLLFCAINTYTKNRLFLVERI